MKNWKTAQDLLAPLPGVSDSLTIDRQADK